jgi:hypothetical protein
LVNIDHSFVWFDLNQSMHIVYLQFE